MNILNEDGVHHLILRDHLAIERTSLANERTFLSYLRTALTMLAIGATFIHLASSWDIKTVGWAFVWIAIGLAITGFIRYRNVQKVVAASERNNVTGVISLKPLTLAQMGTIGAWILEKGFNIFHIGAAARRKKHGID